MRGSFCEHSTCLWTPNLCIKQKPFVQNRSMEIHVPVQYHCKSFKVIISNIPVSWNVCWNLVFVFADTVNLDTTPVATCWSVCPQIYCVSGIFSPVQVSSVLVVNVQFYVFCCFKCKFSVNLIWILKFKKKSNLIWGRGIFLLIRWFLASVSVRN